MHRTSSLLTFFILLCMSLSAQTYSYTLSWDQPSSHEYHVSLETQKAAGEVTRFRLPVWRPGRYYFMNYPIAVSGFEAKNAAGKALEWRKTEKDVWEVKNPAEGKIRVSYRFYANVSDAGSSFLGVDEAYFNGSNLFMYVDGKLDAPCTLTVPSMPKKWKAATALQKGKAHNEFSASNYHDFIDAPTILSPSLKTLEMKLDGVTYFLHFQGKFEGGKDVEEKIKTDFAKIIREQVAVFGEIPLTEYHFIYKLLPYRYRHAVEHKYSACFTLPDNTVSATNRVSSMYGITSHEFWHLWNVKRIRPAALWPYDYSKEAYTSLHWFTEGVTDYYTNLILVRAGLLSRESYFDQLAGLLARLDNSYAASQVSPAESSFDSWLSGSEYANPHLQTSYYSLGSRAGLILDLEIRAESENTKSLDDVFRYLYNEYYKKGKGVPEDGVKKAVEAVLNGQNWDRVFDNHIHGTDPVPWAEVFEFYGLRLDSEPAENPGWEAVGVQRTEKTSQGIYVHSVDPESDAANAGLGDKDLILKVNGKPATDFDAEEFLNGLEEGAGFSLEVYQNGVVNTLKVEFTGDDWPVTYSLSPGKTPSAGQKALLENWLSSKVK